MARPTTPPDSSRLGPIEPGNLYPVAVLMARAGLGRWAIRQLRRERGLPIRMLGGRSYILGADFIRVALNDDARAGTPGIAKNPERQGQGEYGS